MDTKGLRGWSLGVREGKGAQYKQARQAGELDS